ncbi:hypothetical protein AGMMS49959_01980 [Planctomycetales bacterium]|nr:hypothetical protein AGMMS49959_01980 [Planctomycetales bacterium]
MTIAPTTAEIFGRLSATVKRQGKNPRTRYHDLWLAAQAIEAGYSLLTTNAADFIGLPDLQLLTL